MKVDSFTPAANTTINSNTDVLGKLKSGDTVRAQILENSGSELTLKLSDGSTVSASSMSPVEAREGEYVNFVFRGTIDGKPALEVAARAIPPQVDTTLENIKNTLTALNMPITEQNIEFALALKEQNVPVTSEAMAKMTELINKNGDLKPATAAFLTASNMVGDKNNIEKLQNLLAGRLKLSNDIGELIELSNKLSGLSTANESDANSTFVKPVLNNILEKLTAQSNQKGTAQTGNTVVSNEEGNKQIAQNASINDNIANNVNKNNTNSNINIKPASIENIAEEVSKNTQNIKAESQNSIQNTLTDIDKANSTLNKSNAINTADKAANNDTAKNTNNQAGVAEQIRSVLKGGEPLTKSDLPLLNSIKDELVLIASSNQDGMSQEEVNAVKLLTKEIELAITKLEGKEATAKELSSTEKNAKTFENAVNNLKNLIVKVDEKSDEIDPIKLYKKMNAALDEVRASIQHLPSAMKEAALNVVSNLESNINFINQLNNYSSYVQLPLSIFNQNTTGELYMLKKGSKARKLDPSNMTILISLDSNNIGRIDTLLSVDKKNISTNFRLENSEVFQELKENHKTLYMSLLEKGYRLVDFTYRLMDEPINIVNFEAEAKKEFIKSSNNIDITI